MLGLKNLFEGHEDFRFAGNSIAVGIDGAHGGLGLLGVESIVAASHGEDVIEEKVEFVGVESSGPIAVVLHEYLVNVRPQLLITDAH